MPAQEWLRLARGDEAVSRALRAFAQERVRWGDLYHAFEIVEASVGSRMYDEGWITRRDANLFTWTANSPAVVGEEARHGQQRNDPPANPMPEEDAQRVIRTLVTHWLEWKVAGDA